MNNLNNKNKIISSSSSVSSSSSPAATFSSTTQHVFNTTGVQQQQQQRQYDQPTQILPPTDCGKPAGNRMQTVVLPNKPIGSWVLNKNKLKELGIELSIKNALSKAKQTKQTNNSLQKTDKSKSPSANAQQTLLTSTALNSLKICNDFTTTQSHGVTVGGGGVNDVNVPGDISSTDVNGKTIKILSNVIVNKESPIKITKLINQTPQPPTTSSTTQAKSSFNLNSSNLKQTNKVNLIKTGQETDTISMKQLLNSRILARIEQKKQSTSVPLPINPFIPIVHSPKTYGKQDKIQNNEIQSVVQQSQQIQTPIHQPKLPQPPINQTQLPQTPPLSLFNNLTITTSTESTNIYDQQSNSPEFLGFTSNEIEDYVNGLDKFNFPKRQSKICDLGKNDINQNDNIVKNGTLPTIKPNRRLKIVPIPIGRISKSKNEPKRQTSPLKAEKPQPQLSPASQSVECITTKSQLLLETSVITSKVTENQPEQQNDIQIEEQLKNKTPTVETILKSTIDDDIPLNHSTSVDDSDQSSEDEYAGNVIKQKQYAKPTLISLLAERVDRSDLVADILKLHKSRFIDYSDDYDEDDESDVNDDGSNINKFPLNNINKSDDIINNDSINEKTAKNIEIDEKKVINLCEVNKEPNKPVIKQQQSFIIGAAKLTNVKKILDTKTLNTVKNAIKNANLQKKNKIKINEINVEKNSDFMGVILPSPPPPPQETSSHFKYELCPTISDATANTADIDATDGVSFLEQLFKIQQSSLPTSPEPTLSLAPSVELVSPSLEMPLETDLVSSTVPPTIPHPVTLLTPSPVPSSMASPSPVPAPLASPSPPDDEIVSLFPPLGERAASPSPELETASSLLSLAASHSPLPSLVASSPVPLLSPTPAASPPPSPVPSPPPSPVPVPSPPPSPVPSPPPSPVPVPSPPPSPVPSSPPSLNAGKLDISATLPSFSTSSSEIQSPISTRLLSPSPSIPPPEPNTLIFTKISELIDNNKSLEKNIAQQSEHIEIGEVISPQRSNSPEIEYSIENPTREQSLSPKPPSPQVPYGLPQPSPSSSSFPSLPSTIQLQSPLKLFRPIKPNPITINYSTLLKQSPTAECESIYLTATQKPPTQSALPIEIQPTVPIISEEKSNKQIETKKRNQLIKPKIKLKKRIPNLVIKSFAAALDQHSLASNNGDNKLISEDTEESIAGAISNESQTIISEQISSKNLETNSHTTTVANTLKDINVTNIEQINNLDKEIVTVDLSNTDNSENNIQLELIATQAPVDHNNIVENVENKQDFILEHEELAAIKNMDVESNPLLQDVYYEEIVEMSQSRSESSMELIELPTQTSLTEIDPVESDENPTEQMFDKTNIQEIVVIEEEEVEKSVSKFELLPSSPQPPPPQIVQNYIEPINSKKKAPKRKSTNIVPTEVIELPAKRQRKVKNYAELFDEPKRKLKKDSFQFETVEQSLIENIIPSLEITSLSSQPPVSEEPITPKTPKIRKTPKNAKKILENNDNEDQPMSSMFLTPEISQTPPLSSSTPTTITATPESSSDTNKMRRLGRGYQMPEPYKGKLPDTVVCGCCKENVKSKLWSAHDKLHYGLGWRDGFDVTPIDSPAARATRIKNYIKKHHIPYLKCPKCPEIRKSAVGYLGHLEMCGLTEEERLSKRVRCETCDGEFMPGSMISHRQHCPGLRQLQLEQKLNDLENGDDDDDNNNSDDNGSSTGMRQQRKSAKKALNSFKQINDMENDKVEKSHDIIRRTSIVSGKLLKRWNDMLKQNEILVCPLKSGCDFTAINSYEMKKHYEKCVLIKEEHYYCTKCAFKTNSYDLSLVHIKIHMDYLNNELEKDFSGSDSDAKIEMEETESESDGDSGDEEIESNGNEINEVDDDDDGDDDDGGYGAGGYDMAIAKTKTKSNNLIKSRPRPISTESPEHLGIDRKVLRKYAVKLNPLVGTVFYVPAIDWIQEFRDKHYSTEPIFSFAVPNLIKLLSHDESIQFDPVNTISEIFAHVELEKYNKQFGATIVNSEWHQLPRYATHLISDTFLMYCGGSIVAMEWMPLPDNFVESQLLAVVCKLNNTDEIYREKRHPYKTSIQIWIANKLINQTEQRLSMAAQTKRYVVNKNNEPKLLYNIGIDCGPVLSIAFCPSGGFTNDRFGLLAVPQHDGRVHILSLPKNVTTISTTNLAKTTTTLTIKPSIILDCSLDPTDSGAQITKIIWTKIKKHKLIVAGYANGIIHIWNLDNLNHKLLVRIENDIKIISPISIFQALTNCITQIDLHHDRLGDPRWLLVGGYDRRLNYYDLNNLPLPLSSKILKSRIMGGYWPINWPSHMSIIDDENCLFSAGLIIDQSLNIGTRTFIYNSCYGSAQDMGFSDWLNTYVYVSDQGEIRGGYSKQMLSDFSASHARHRAAFSYVDVVNRVKSKANDGSSGGSGDTNQNGLVFCDFNPPIAQSSIKACQQRIVPLQHAHYCKINKCSVNPNANSYKWFAIGYESGFVRLLHMKLPKKNIYGSSNSH